MGCEVFVEFLSAAIVIQFPEQGVTSHIHTLKSNINVVKILWSLEMKLCSS
jgi:hypothetical protein